jgi:hypothetical protein
LDLCNLTPLQALNALAALQQQAREPRARDGSEG